MGGRDSGLPSSIEDELEREAQIYKSRKQETEEAYYTAYSATVKGTPGEPSTGPRCGFLIHSASFLAHVQLMMGVLRPQDLVFVLGPSSRSFDNRIPCRVISLPAGLSVPDRFELLRKRMKEEQVGTLIWVSVPLWANYGFSLRLAKKQVFWAMRFHSVAPGDLNITAGRRDEKTRVYHGIEWTCVHAPFNVRVGNADLIEAEKKRPFPYCYGVMAREEKIANPDYLACVARILKQHPGSGFLWTGRQERSDIRNFFREQGLSNRHRFMGWQDADKYMPALDCYLETFPLGGITTFYAMGHGVPVVAMRQEHSPIGSLDSPPDGALFAASVTDYVSNALAAKEQPARDKAIAAGRKIYDAELKMQEQDKNNFWRIIESAGKACDGNQSRS